VKERKMGREGCRRERMGRYNENERKKYVKKEMD
jgi:hypothetical protein